jgi:hypothetical protein
MHTTRTNKNRRKLGFSTETRENSCFNIHSVIPVWGVVTPRRRNNSCCGCASRSAVLTDLPHWELITYRPTVLLFLRYPANGHFTGQFLLYHHKMTFHSGLILETNLITISVWSFPQILRIAATWILYFGVMTAFSPNYYWILLLRGLVGCAFGGAVQSYVLKYKVLNIVIPFFISVSCCHQRWSAGYLEMVCVHPPVHPSVHFSSVNGLGEGFWCIRNMFGLKIIFQV